MMQLLGTLIRIIPLVVGTIGAVESMFKAIKGKGSDKKDAYIAGIMAALGVSEVGLNRDLLNEEQTKKLEELLGRLGDDIIAVNNFIHDLKPKEE